MRGLLKAIRPPRTAALAVLSGLGCWLLLGVYTVKQGEVGVMLRFGRTIDDQIPAGIHYALPWPFNRVHTVSLSRIVTFRVGGADASGRAITGDLNIINAVLLATYRIEDPARFLFGSEAPRTLAQNAVETGLNRVLNNMPVDEALTTGKAIVGEWVKQWAQHFLDKEQTGIRLLSVHLQQAVPPKEVAGAFKEVMNARADKLRIITEARTSAGMKASRARTEAFEMVSEAKAYADRRVKGAEGKCEALTIIMDTPDSEALRSRLSLKTLGETLPRLKKILLPPGRKSPVTILK